MKKLFLILFCGFLPTLLAGSAVADSPAFVKVDMNPFAAPANTATRIGSIEDCAQINANGQTDADEEGVDSLVVDLVLPPPGISEQTPLLAFYVEVSFPAELVLTKEEANFLITANPGSSFFNASEPLPATNRFWRAYGADVGNGPAESGPGVLVRLTLESTQGAKEGFYSLSLPHAFSIDPNNDTHPLDVGNKGVVSVNQACKPLDQIPPELIVSGPSVPASDSNNQPASNDTAAQLPSTGGLQKEDLKPLAPILMIGGMLTVIGAEIILAIAYYKGKR